MIIQCIPKAETAAVPFVAVMERYMFCLVIQLFTVIQFIPILRININYQNIIFVIEGLFGCGDTSKGCYPQQADNSGGSSAIYLRFIEHVVKLSFCD